MRKLASSLVVAAALAVAGAAPGVARAVAEPPLAASSNVHLLTHIPGTAAGMNFSGHYAYVSGWTGITVLDIAVASAPQVVGVVPLPHFENEDIDLCGTTLVVVNDREAKDLGSIMYVLSIANPVAPAIVAVLPLGLTGSGRGSGHIANFVKPDCTQLWVDGGDHVEVVDVTVPSAPRSLGKFESAASLSANFKVSHDTELDTTGTVWNVGGGGAAAYRITADPLAPQLVGTTGAAGVNPSPYNDFILHNSQRRGKTLLITEEDYIDTDEVPPGGCRGQGKFETWDVSRLNKGAITPLGTWETELNGMFTGGAVDSKAPVTVNCSSHWFDAKDGVAAVGWYEQGVRFLDYRTPTDITQVGYYIPANGSTWAAYWSPTDPKGEIVYTADAYRGVDVLKIDGGGLTGKKVKAPVRNEWFGSPTLDSASFQSYSTFGFMCPFLKPDLAAP
ncbi:MAG: LVIVD repeat-containing protein [Gaiellaceae bacterium]